MAGFRVGGQARVLNWLNLTYAEGTIEKFHLEDREIVAMDVRLGSGTLVPAVSVELIQSVDESVPHDFLEDPAAVLVG